MYVRAFKNGATFFGRPECGESTAIIEIYGHFFADLAFARAILGRRERQTAEDWMIQTTTIAICNRIRDQMANTNPAVRPEQTTKFDSSRGKYQMKTKRTEPVRSKPQLIDKRLLTITEEVEQLFGINQCLNDQLIALNKSLHALRSGQIVRSRTPRLKSMKNVY